MITYDVADGVVYVPSDTPDGSYLISLTLTDDNEDSKSTKYRFRINVQEQIVFEIE